MSCFDRFKISAAEFPAELPIFPLPGGLLLPGGRLPLNIFEPRFLNMVLAAMQSPSRLIGMIQPMDGESMDDDTELYKTGCAGRISSFSETNDNRILITLHGVCRFDAHEARLAPGGYRTVRADWSAYIHDLEPDAKIEIDRPAVLKSLREYFDHIKMPVDWDAVQSAPNEVLINSLAMACPFDFKEQQLLLEAPKICDRAKIMCCLLQMGMHECGDNKH
jgi:Lon protease-like protein